MKVAHDIKGRVKSQAGLYGCFTITEALPDHTMTLNEHP